ncbi:uncharacterized protein LOC124681699 [Lolium rigidum]|uniref:uncharacterized protein LOC124681699 n=1 Tax=Lolium rigidum TaxID=89674 RepID=UPI001F5C9BF1|nr:uncharacterized protein LOC124681699 [Lolium rigidum]
MGCAAQGGRGNTLLLSFPVLRNDVWLLHDAPPPLATPWNPVLSKSRLSLAAISNAFTDFRDSGPSIRTPDGVAAYEPEDIDFHDGRGGARVLKEDARVGAGALLRPLAPFTSSPAPVKSQSPSPASPASNVVVTLPAKSCCNREKSEDIQTGHVRIPQLVSVAFLSLYQCALLISIAWINHSPGTCSLLQDSGAWMEAAMWRFRRGSQELRTECYF